MNAIGDEAEGLFHGDTFIFGQMKKFNFLWLYFFGKKVVVFEWF